MLGQPAASPSPVTPGGSLGFLFVRPHLRTQGQWPVPQGGVKASEPVPWNRPVSPLVQEDTRAGKSAHAALLGRPGSKPTASGRMGSGPRSGASCPGLGDSRGLTSTVQEDVPTGSDRAPSPPSVAAPSLTRPCRRSSAPPRPEVLQGEASPAPLSSASPSVPFSLWFQSHKNQEMSSGKITPSFHH